jgi:amino acid transporter
MPSFQLTDAAEARFEAISFFLLVFLLVTLAVWALWNRLRRDVPRLPRLGFGAALAMVFLWGLGFQLVLSMIAGGRELMTPGAWQKKGATYQLTQTPPPSDKELASQARRQRLEALRVALWTHAAAHGGQFPASDLGPDIPEEHWKVLGSSGMHFIYVSGQKADGPAAPLAYEPGIFGKERWVLFTNGDIRQLPVESIHAALAGVTP